MRGSKILLFIISLIIWFILSWSLSQKSIIAGIFISAVVALIAGDLFTKNPHKMIRLKRYLWFFVYVFMIAWDMLKAVVEVLLMILTPRMKIQPKTLMYTTKLKSGTGITALANTISLIPGMSTMDIDETEDMVLHIHLMKKESEASLIAKIRKYENLFRDIYEEI